MANISTWLREAEARTGETINAIVVGVHYDRRYGMDTEAREDEHVTLSREDGLKKLDLDYDNGYSGADCYPMYAWTDRWVYFVSEYDGATCLSRVPRNPGPCAPGFDGSMSDD